MKRTSVSRHLGRNMCRTVFHSSAGLPRAGLPGGKQTEGRTEELACDTRAVFHVKLSSLLSPVNGQHSQGKSQQEIPASFAMPGCHAFSKKTAFRRVAQASCPDRKPCCRSRAGTTSFRLARARRTQRNHCEKQYFDTLQKSVWRGGYRGNKAVFCCINL